MNKEMRKRLNQAREILANTISNLEDIASEIECLQEEEQEKFDNASDSLQATVRFLQIEENASALEELLDAINEAIDSLNDIDCNDVWDL